MLAQTGMRMCEHRTCVISPGTALQMPLRPTSGSAKLRRQGRLRHCAQHKGRTFHGRPCQQFVPLILIFASMFFCSSARAEDRVKEQ